MTGSNRGGSGGGGRRQLKVRLKTARQRSASSQRWLERQLNDPYVSAAKHEGYRSRAAFKLTEIDDRHRLLKPGKRVVDLGAAPGGWGQVAATRVRSRDGKGQVVGDRPAADGAGHRRRRSCSSTSWTTAPRRGCRACCVTAARTSCCPTWPRQGTGHTRTDHLRVMALAEAAIEFACDILEPGGAFLCKVFQGGTEHELLATLKRAFASVKHVKPPASRTGSAELYVLATGFRGR